MALHEKQAGFCEITAWAQEYLKFHYLWTQFVCIPKMQVKAISCKVKAIYDYDPEMSPSSLGQSISKMVCGRVEKNALWLYLNLTFFLRNGENFQLVINTQFKSLSDGCRGALLTMKWAPCTYTHCSKTLKEHIRYQ